jgi:hypothetical protein
MFKGKQDALPLVCLIATMQRLILKFSFTLILKCAENSFGCGWKVSTNILFSDLVKPCF